MLVGSKSRIKLWKFILVFEHPSCTCEGRACSNWRGKQYLTKISVVIIYSPGCWKGLIIEILLKFKYNSLTIWTSDQIFFLSLFVCKNYRKCSKSIFVRLLIKVFVVSFGYSTTLSTLSATYTLLHTLIQIESKKIMLASHIHTLNLTSTWHIPILST